MTCATCTHWKGQRASLVPIMGDCVHHRRYTASRDTCADFEKGTTG